MIWLKISLKLNCFNGIVSPEKRINEKDIWNSTIEMLYDSNIEIHNTPEG